MPLGLGQFNQTTAFASLIMVAAVATSAPASAAPPPSVSPKARTAVMTAPVPALLPLAEQFDMTSAITGRTYRIYVSKPLVPEPPGGYPVLYVLDAGTAFATAQSQALLATRLEKTKPLMVVGVGYPDITKSGDLRRRDFTPFLPIAGQDWKGEVKPEEWNGADAFHKFMMQELRPVIERMAKVNKADQSLMGYSLGGLFAINVLLTNPESYNTYVIGSPAIFYSNRKVLEGLRGFKRKVEAGKVAPRVLISTNELEQSADPSSLPPSFRMVDNARELAEALRQMKGAPGFKVDYTSFAQETHNHGIPAATSRGVAFVINGEK